MWKTLQKILIIFGVMILSFACGAGKQKTAHREGSSADSLFILVGSYASPQTEGVKLFSFDEEGGEAHYISGIKGISNPSYLTPSADGKYVYAVGENDPTESTANALSIDWNTKKISLLNEMPTQGAAPCYIALSPHEDFVLTANYNGGNISIFRRGENGKLLSSSVIGFTGNGVDPERQDQPHLHCIGFTPDGLYTLAVDLGTDCIHVFPITHRDKNDSTPFVNEDKSQNFLLPAGCGPRHLCFSSDGRFMYLITELSGEVLVMAYKGENTELIQRIQADTLKARGSADIHLSPDGQFLYASNRLKGDGIAIFKVNRDNGTLKKIAYRPTGIHPRNFVISPNGNFLLVACRDTDEIQIFRRNKETGLLHYTGNSIHTSQPTCLKFVTKK